MLLVVLGPPAVSCWFLYLNLSPAFCFLLGPDWYTFLSHLLEHLSQASILPWKWQKLILKCLNWSEFIDTQSWEVSYLDSDMAGSRCCGIIDSSFHYAGIFLSPALVVERWGTPISGWQFCQLNDHNEKNDYFFPSGVPAEVLIFTLIGEA